MRRTPRRKAIVLEPYRGYGSREEIFLIGRVFRQPRRRGRLRGTLGDDLFDIARRLLRRGLAGIAIEADFLGRRETFVTDKDGYFRISMKPATRPAGDRLWHHVRLRMEAPEPIEARGEVFIPPDASPRVVISDIDDTVIETGVANKIRMLWRMFMQGSRSRTAFPGVAAFYRALHAGPGGNERNAMLYVSRGPWTIYEVLDAFFRLHRIPVGPVLFLREWGVRWRHPFPRRSENHKARLIRHMMGLMDERPVVLIGDSGQHDPEIYAGIVRDFPGRVAAIYIRDVSPDERRDDAIRELGRELERQGAPLVLAQDTRTMADHAVSLGLIDPGALDDLETDRRADLAP